MRWQYYLLVYGITILFCVGLVAGAVTTIVNVTPKWIVANGRDSSNIRVIVTDEFSGTPIPNAVVNFSVNDSTLGFVSPETGQTTDVNGSVSTVFRSKTKSGTANISVSVNGTVQGSGLVFIDHDTPYSFRLLSSPDNATVGSVQNIFVGLQDIWGNFVDNRNKTEYIEFSIITLGDASRLWNSTAGNFSAIDMVLPNNDIGITITNISLATSWRHSHPDKASGESP